MGRRSAINTLFNDSSCRACSSRNAFLILSTLPRKKGVFTYESLRSGDHLLIPNLERHLTHGHLIKSIKKKRSSASDETESYQQLTKQIALGRKLSLTTTANWDEGKVFTGTQALALGLINELGSSSTVTRVIKEKALIENEIEWIEGNSFQSSHLKLNFN